MGSDASTDLALLKVEAVDSENPEEAKKKTLFDNLTPLYPNEMINLENDPDEMQSVYDNPANAAPPSLLPRLPKSCEPVVRQKLRKS